MTCRDDGCIWQVTCGVECVSVRVARVCASVPGGLPLAASLAAALHLYDNYFLFVFVEESARLADRRFPEPSSIVSNFMLNRADKILFYQTDSPSRWNTFVPLAPPRGLDAGSHQSTAAVKYKIKYKTKVEWSVAMKRFIFDAT
ncbi:unnamed protein product [Pieris brassicae]|uniref:Uncharacterized protein n=1 Tax=Pieris brassicae TaxID=7116 RepID=A0A9P0TD79_PIEBR|nr:unnamed protein product [Pieris brassicae]